MNISLFSCLTPISSQTSSTQNSSVNQAAQQQVQPADSILCNGTNWSKCPSGESFVCPASGSAYCQSPQQQSSTQSVQQNYQQPQDQGATQQQAAQQQKINDANALVAEYNGKKNVLDQQIATLNQQIIDIKTKYASDVAGIQSQPIPLEFQDGQIQKLTDTDNGQIQAINLQIQQIQQQEQVLYVDYQAKINAL